MHVQDANPPTPGKPVLFWECLEGEDKPVYYNRATHTKIPTEPFIARGGILAGAKRTPPGSVRPSMRLCVQC